MDAVVLAGGYATRMWPITTHRPKMLLPLGDETVIDRLLTALESDDRIEVVYLSTNRQFAPIFREYLAGTSYEKPTLSVEETTAEADKLGVVGALAQLVDREGLSSDLLVVAGDNIFDFSMREFVDFFEESESTAVAVYDVGSRANARSYGVVDVEDGRIVDFHEKPRRPASTLVSVACYAFPTRSSRNSRRSSTPTMQTRSAGSSSGSTCGRQSPRSRSTASGSTSAIRRAT